MASSGVSVKDDVVNEFNNIKIGHKYRFIQMKLSTDRTAIEIEKTVESGKADKSPAEGKKAYEEFVHQLPSDDCRYAIYDFHFETNNAGSRDQLIFIVWCPENAPTKSKMLYASSKDALKKKLVGITHEIQANEHSDLNHSEITDKVLSRVVN
ncbi:hypothetical protein HELRODRAFT_167462 [Helobdella robusta]|uniref:ADF-H domain-containing protein n=1 Tax=Helobdella robusta TaxID=6412 RepID=T1EZE5_HELRO|nr:hypothetical protein HELRODRAFT_167462 [Helobdella robusta]ESO10948.1 hypothetical protein HELRODRAFT_167462 [Helobdella robusta]